MIVGAKFFYRPDALLVIQSTVSKHCWKDVELNKTETYRVCQKFPANFDAL